MFYYSSEILILINFIRLKAKEMRFLLDQGSHGHIPSL